MANNYAVPQDLWAVSAALNFDQPLDKDDPRYVPTGEARGDFRFAKLYKQLGVDPHTLQLRQPQQTQYILFCGHVGCGKSTELRQQSAKLHRPEAYCCVFLDVLVELDPHNLEYSDISVALAKRLLDQLDEQQVPIDTLFLTPLQDWFTEQVEQHQTTHAFACDIKAGLQGKTGIPFIGGLFTAITAACKTNTLYKKELRRALKQSFGQFSQAFNQLVLHAEQQLQQTQQGQKILFVVDGTDRMRQADRQRLLIDDVYQLQQLHGCFIYCAPIGLIYQENSINQLFHYVCKLPMIKLADKGDHQPYQPGHTALKNMVYRRAAPELFDPPELVDTLIAHSGGHPRDLLRLLNYAFQAAEGDVFNQAAVDDAIRQLASDYRRLLTTDDYAFLYQIDQAPSDETNHSDQAQHLLYHLALLEYNGFWWQSHPIIRTLPGYHRAADEAAADDGT